MAAKKTEHSANFKKLRNYYKLGYWNEYRLGVAVEKGWITAEEYLEITGQEYTTE